MDKSKEEMLLEAAMKLFNEFGFHATPTSKISKEAGVSAGTLYNYFESKEELINSLYLKIKKNSTDYVKNKMIDTDDPVENMKNTWKSYVRWGVENPRQHKFKEIYCQSPFINTLSREMVDESIKGVKTCFMKAMDEGVIRNEEFDLIMAVFGGSVTWAIRYILNNGQDDMEEIMDRCFDLLWEGIGNK